MKLLNARNAKLDRQNEQDESLSSPDAIQNILEAEYAHVEELQLKMRSRIEDILSSLGGQKFPSIKAKKAVATKINGLLNFAGARIECPKCGDPAIIRCYAVGNAKDGAFQFEHFEPIQTRHGGSVNFPGNLRVVVAPPDSRKVARSKKTD